VRHLIESFELLSDSNDHRVWGLNQILEALGFHVIVQCGIEVLMTQHQVQDPMMDHTRQQGGEALAQIMQARVRQVGTA
jgi:hypothetical protein